MAHYAFLDENNVVVDIIVGKDEDDDYDWEQHYGDMAGMKCKRTSYNTYSNAHPSGTPFRKNYATIGGTYDEERDAFIPPKQYQSWVLNGETCCWDPPISYPSDGHYYQWNEETLSWDGPLDTTP